MIQVVDLPLSWLAMLSCSVLALAILGVFYSNAYALQPRDLTGYSESKITVVEKNAEPVSCRDDQIKATHLVARDQGGNIIKQTTTGSQVLLEATVVSGCDLDDQPVTLIFEVRDAEGITNHLTWQTGTIDAKERFTAGASWVAPEKPGVYEARFFKISCLQCPMVLNQVMTYKLIVVAAQ